MSENNHRLEKSRNVAVLNKKYGENGQIDVRQRESLNAIFIDCKIIE